MATPPRSLPRLSAILMALGQPGACLAAAAGLETRSQKKKRLKGEAWPPMFERGRTMYPHMEYDLRGFLEREPRTSGSMLFWWEGMRNDVTCVI